MIIIGADYHPAFQQIAFVDTETGELQERRLEHPEVAEKFYRELAAQAKKVRVGMEASGHARWFERLPAELNFELWIGDAAEIRRKRERKQKTDRQDAQHILRLILKDDFPQIWVPSGENRDLRQLLWRRHRMVQARTRIINQLQAVALNEGLRCKKRLWREKGREQLESFRLAPWASRRRHDLLELLDRLNPTIAELSQAIEQEVEKCPEAQRLMTHPGVGPLTALTFVLIIGGAYRFQCGKQIASYLGLVPLEDWSGNRRRLGHITKQGNSLLRFLLVEAAQVTVRSLPEWRSKYVHLTMRRGRKIAKVAMARKLAVRLYWMMRKGWNYEQVKKFGSHAGQPGTPTDGSAMEYTLAAVKDNAHIWITDATTEMRLAWLGFDGDDCFGDFRIDVTSEAGSQKFCFGPCAVHGLRKLSRFFRDGSQASVGLGFQQPDIRCCDFVRANEGYRLLVRFESRGLSEQFFVRKPSVEIDDGLLTA